MPEAYSERVLGVRTTRQRGREVPSGFWIRPIPDRMEPVDPAVVRLSLSFSPFRVDFSADYKLLVGPRRKVLKSLKLLAMLIAQHPQFSSSKPRTIRSGEFLIMLCKPDEDVGLFGAAQRERSAAVAAL